MWKFLAAVALVAVLLPAAAAQAAGGPEVGSKLPDFTLAAALKPAQAAYLGIPKDAASFPLSQVAADFALIEIFSMYCPFCQREAAKVNELYKRLVASPQAGRIKLLAIGAGNSGFEVDVFRDQYKVPFPMVPDEDFSVHKALGRVGTPFFLLVDLRPGPDRFRVALAHEGPFQDTGAFFQTVLAAAGPKK